MRDYSCVSPSFWIGETGRQVRALGIESQLVALYLITSPHANMIGLYYLPLAYISIDTGIPLEGASKSLASLSEAGFCRYDEKSEFVYVPEMARFQIGDSLKATDNRVVGINREVRQLANKPFLLDFYAKYRDRFQLEKVEKLEAALKGLATPSEAKNRNKNKNNKNPPADAAGGDPPAAKVKTVRQSSDHGYFVAWFCYAHETVVGYSYKFQGGKDGSLVSELLSKFSTDSKPLSALVARACNFFVRKDDLLDKNGRTIGMLSSRINALPPFQNGDAARFRSMGILPPEGVMLTDWKPWEEVEHE